MIRIARKAFLSLALFALLAVPVRAQDTVAGTWIVTMNAPDIGELQIPFEFAQSGTEVTGTVDFPMAEVEAAEMSDGLYEDGILSWVMHVGAQGQWIAVEMEADVEGDEMVGEAYVAEMGQVIAFTAKRADG